LQDIYVREPQHGVHTEPHISLVRGIDLKDFVLVLGPAYLSSISGAPRNRIERSWLKWVYNLRKNLRVRRIAGKYLGRFRFRAVFLAYRA
jgi:hypothetical protein